MWFLELLKLNLCEPTNDNYAYIMIPALVPEEIVTIE